MVKRFTYGRNFEYKDSMHIVEFLWSVKNKKEMQYLLTALFTHQELEEAVRRLLVAKSLGKGSTYRDIEEKYKMSTSTINSIFKKIKTNPVFKRFVT